MTTFLSRSAWTSTSAGGATLTGSELVGVAVHWPGTSAATIGDPGQAAIASRLRSYRTYHVGTRGWSDIGYNLAIDQAGRVWQCRTTQWRGNRVGAHAASAGNPRANHKYVGVLLLLGASESPSHAMIQAFRDWYHNRFLTGWPGRTDVRGHGQVPGAQTACPGSRARNAISDMTRKPSGGTSPPPSTGGSVTITQDDAREVWRFKNERLTDRDAYSFLREVERIYARVNDRIAYNAWMQARWPDDRSDGWTPRTYWRNGYGHAKRNTETIEGTVIPLLQEIKAAQGGAARDEVLADIQATLAEARQERQAIGDRLDDLLAGHELMRAEVQAALSGEKDAADALRALAAILNAALEES